MSDPSLGPAHPTIVGTTLAGQFLIEKRIGEGGMGAVYLATQLGMDRKVVVKVMHPELTAGSASAVQRFQREARAVALLNHPNIVQVHVFGQSDAGQLYQAMEYIDGRDLSVEFARGPMKQDRALMILSQITAALADAHAAGIVHRDLKPENIMLTDRHGNADWVKVLDFGIAKLREPETGKSPTALTQAGAVFGTPAYMAPEQVRGLTVDGRSDLYAVGVILHEMVTGSHPFDALSPIDFLIKHANEEIVPPAQRFPKLNLAPAVCEIIERLMIKDPMGRYQSAAELQEAIQQALSRGGFSTVVASAMVSNPMVIAMSQTPPAGVSGRSELGLGETVTHVPSDRPKKAPKTAIFVALGLLLTGGTIALAVGLSGPGSTELAGAGLPQAPAVVALVAPTKPAPEPVQEVPEPVVAEAADVTETPDDVGGADDIVVAIATPEPEEFEGFIAPPGTSLLKSTNVSLRLSVPLNPSEIFAFYAEAFPDTTRQIKNGLEFTDRDFAYRSFTISVDGVEIIVQALRRAPTATRVDSVVRAPPPTKPDPEKIVPEPIATRPTRPPTEPAQPVVVTQPVVVAQPTQPVLTPPPIVIHQPGTLPAEIRLPDGTVLPTGAPQKKEEKDTSGKEVYRAVKDTQKTIKDALRGGKLPFGL